MNLVSIQSHVVYGHVGNAAAVFPLQRLGCEVWPINTVQLSNHAGYGQWRGERCGAGAISDLVGGLVERGVLSSCDGVLSGYLGSAELGAELLAAVAQVKAANPAAAYCCDPVIGDVGRGVYVASGIPEFMRQHAVAAADVVTPNQFELEYLAGRPTLTLKSALDAVDHLHHLGPRAVLVTSVHTQETPAGSIDLLASDARGRSRVRTPLLPIVVNGAGDAIAALFFLQYLTTGSAARALSYAASAIFGVIERTVEAGSREILLIEAQEEFVRPSRWFVAERL